jgi:hypothetical protein
MKSSFLEEVSDQGTWDDLFQRLPEASGLQPQLWISVGSGYVREEIKAAVLAKGQGFIGDAITSLPELCLKIAGISSDALLSAYQRYEILRKLLAEPRIMSEFKQIHVLKRQRGFLTQLDQALQAGRMAFAHTQEMQVYHERLQASLGFNVMHEELLLFSQGYVAWLEASGWVDLPLLIQKATSLISQVSFSLPESIWILSNTYPESLEQAFWDELSQKVAICRMKPRVTQASFVWKRWHTLDEAAEQLAQKLAVEGQEDQRYAILIPDVPSVRRSLMRALQRGGVAVFDPRDPTQVRMEEVLKWAFLPLEVVGSRYEMDRVVSWVQSLPDASEAVSRIYAAGIRQGLSSYRKIPEVYAVLTKLGYFLGGKKTCEQMAQAHEACLQEIGCLRLESYPWILPWIRQLWKKLFEDEKKLGFETKKAPLLFWLEKMRLHLKTASPFVSTLKPEKGVYLYRLDQVSLIDFEKVWIFGLPPDWLQEASLGDGWYSDLDRELLSSEFQVRSRFQLREERIKSLRSWNVVEDLELVDAYYEMDGWERGSLLSVLKAMQIPYVEVKEKMPSFFLVEHPIEEVQAQFIELSRSVGTLSASTLDRFSRCGFQALAYDRWKLKDLRLPSVELWPEVKGKILHACVFLMMRSLKEGLPLSARQALESAWKKSPPEGLFFSERILKFIQSKLCRILDTFSEKELLYLDRSEAQLMHLESQRLELILEGGVIVGTPDRVDAYGDGLFVIDYKTSGRMPHASEILEKGYRLQLPFYAVALWKQGHPVLGLQLIALDTEGSRSSGIFFEAFNDPKKGLTAVRASSKSLVQQDPDEIWSMLEEKIRKASSEYWRGEFQVGARSENPKDECDRCRLGGLCGFSRSRHLAF